MQRVCKALAEKGGSASARRGFVSLLDDKAAAECWVQQSSEFVCPPSVQSPRHSWTAGPTPSWCHANPRTFSCLDQGAVGAQAVLPALLQGSPFPSLCTTVQAEQEAGPGMLWFPQKYSRAQTGLAILARGAQEMHPPCSVGL